MPPMLAAGLMRVRHAIKTAVGAVLGHSAVVLMKIIRLVGPDRASDIGGAVLRTIGPLLPEHRTARANLRAAFPEKTDAEIKTILIGAWDNLGRMAGEFAHLGQLWDFDPERQVSDRIEIPPTTLALFERLRDDGRPALVFTAHLANWELPALVAAANGIESAVLFRRPNISQVDRLIRDVRAVNMGQLVPTTFDAPTRLRDLLNRGIHVGMLVDQYYGRGVEVIFFGRRTRANPLLARLARHIDCPIHGVRVIRLPNRRFRIEITEALVPARQSDGSIDVAGTMQAVTNVVEGWIREHPDQWLWMHRRWRPEG